MRAHKRHPCPCCGFDTLNASGAYELCPICLWEDGEDEGETLELRQARANFRDHGNIYPAGTAPIEVMHPSPERTQLITYALSVLSGAEPRDPLLLDGLLLAHEVASEFD